MGGQKEKELGMLNVAVLDRIPFREVGTNEKILFTTIFLVFSYTIASGRPSLICSALLNPFILPFE